MRVESFKHLEGQMRAIQHVAISAALAAGDEVVAVPGKHGTPARQFDIAAHVVLTSLTEQLIFGDDVVLHVLTEETPNFSQAVQDLGHAVHQQPQVPRIAFLFDPVDGSMQYLKAGVGWCTAGLATSWDTVARRWEPIWAAVMLPGGRDAVWLPGGSDTMAAVSKSSVIDTVAINDFKKRVGGPEMLAALDELPWMRYRLTSGGNPIAVSIARTGEAIMVQPMASKPHDAIGTLILSANDHDVYDLTSDTPTEVSASRVQSWFADPTRCHSEDLVPPHVVGPPSAATRNVWEALRPIVMKRAVREG